MWVDHLRRVDCRETRLLRALDPVVEGGDGEAGVDILVGDVVVLEVLRGIDDDGQRERVRAVLIAEGQDAHQGEPATATRDS